MMDQQKLARIAEIMCLWRDDNSSGHADMLRDIEEVLTGQSASENLAAHESATRGYQDCPKCRTSIPLPELGSSSVCELVCPECRHVLGLLAGSGFTVTDCYVEQPIGYEQGIAYHGMKPE